MSSSVAAPTKASSVAPRARSAQVPIATQRRVSSDVAKGRSRRSCAQSDSAAAAPLRCRKAAKSSVAAESASGDAPAAAKAS